MRPIDCDVHNDVPGVDALLPYLRAKVSRSDFEAATSRAYPADTATSTLEGLRQHLDRWQTEVAILCCDFGASNVRNPHVATALAWACNDWQVAEWLEKDARLRASVVVDAKVPRLAAQEIERVGAHPGFVQVVLPVRSEMLYGHRELHPIYEAAVKHDLAIALHFGGHPGAPPTPSGWPSYYIEEYVGMSQVLESQIMNIIAEGVFDRFPTLRMALVECGWAWLPAWMWRMDKEWKGLRREIPWVREAPSEYIRKHMRLTLQPIDPPTTELFVRTVEEMGSDEMLLFSSDYPHVHEPGLPQDLPEPLKAKILSENARSFYRL